MALTLSFRITASATHTSTNDLGQYSGSPKIEYKGDLTSADITNILSDSRTLTVAETLDLTTGLTNQYGTAIALTTLKGIVVHNTSATQTLTIGGGTNAVLGSDQVTIKAGKCWATDSSYAVNGTHKSLLVTPSATGATYDILLVGS